MSIAENFDPDMTKADLDRWNQQVAIANRTRNAAFEFWQALTVIRDERLYRAQFATFEECCQTLWGMSRQYINSGIKAAEIAKDLETIVSISNEGTAREFTKVPKEDRPKVAEEAKAVAESKGRDKINSRDVKEAKAKIYKVETRTEELPPDPDAEPLPTGKPAPTLTEDDGTWLESLPLHSQLQGLPLRKFEEAAQLWQQFEGPFKSLAMQIRAAHKDIAVQFKSKFMTRQLSSFIVDAPQHWLLCRECNGTGQVPQVGACSSCGGDGFHTMQYTRAKR